jgi:ABC-2 type transport system ATP-binding protein
MSPDPGITIRAHNLEKSFRKVRALRGVSFDVPTGAIFALVGPNGAGKTTLIKTLMNIYEPSAGSAEVMGTASRELAGRAFCSIGYVSENQEMMEGMPVRRLFQYLRPFYPTWDTHLESDMIASLRLPLDRKPRQLSRGVRMKVALATSLAFRPKLLVLDEPFSGLDPLVRDEVAEGIVQRRNGATVFLSSHDLAEIEAFATHVGYLEEGRMLFSEGLASLQARFRQVEVTGTAISATGADAPPSWLQINPSDVGVRLVETAFDAAKLPQLVRSYFGESATFTVRPLTLREIFLAMAKAGRRDTDS